MIDGPRPLHASDVPLRRERRRLRTAVAGALLALTVGALASCSGGTPDSETRRRDTDENTSRRGVGEPTVDTTSLVTPVRVDSLVGTARGAGGEASLSASCAICHEGAHAASLGRDAVASATCVACHASSHAPIQALYAGTLRGVSVAPDTMFLARVSCVGCHTDTTFAAPPGGARVAALDGMCTSCHGTRFQGMLDMWRAGMEWRARAVGAYVAQASADARLAGAEARARVRGARASLELLRVAGAVHNVRGADQLFRAVLDSTASAYRRSGVTPPGRPSLGPDPTNNACLTCHYGIEGASITVRDETFDHSSHVVRADLACRECHSDATFFKDASTGTASADKALDPKHGRTTLSPTSCQECHHSPTTQLACATCHGNDERLKGTIRVVMALNLRPEKSPKSRSVAFQHSQHATSECASCHKTAGAVLDVASCSSCHTDHHKERAAGCASCHGATMLTTHAMDTHFKCANCHARETVARLTGDRAFCVSCHVKQVNHEPGRECAPCHLHLSPTEVRARILAAPPAAATR